MAMHPGWVRTEIGVANAPLGKAQSISGMLEVIERLTTKSTRKFFDCDGRELPWLCLSQRVDKSVDCGADYYRVDFGDMTPSHTMERNVSMTRKILTAVFFCFILTSLISCQHVTTTDEPGSGIAHGPQQSDEPEIVIWHGLRQKVGHLGIAQDDFNLMGRVSPAGSIASLTYRLNGGPFVRLNFGEDTPGFRRFAGLGHFNADISMRDLRPGTNSVEVIAVDGTGRRAVQEVIVDLQSGSYQLPVNIDWATIDDPQDVGQYVDGHWELGPDGLRTKHMGYDRIFLIGEKNWQDYEIEVSMIINQVDEDASPSDGGNGLGILFRFTGHINGGPRNFPKMQPKWGYQPFGAITWLRWEPGKPVDTPYMEFHRGDINRRLNHGQFPVEIGELYWMKAKCQSLPDRSNGESVSRYSFKIWRHGNMEPAGWSWQETQISRHAKRKGGVALLAHHVDVTFGNIRIKSL